MKVGLIGLGQMGYSLMLNMLDKGHTVVVWNRSADKRAHAKETSKAIVVDTLEELVNSLEDNKIIFSIISAGNGIDQLLWGDNNNGLASLLSPGDTFIDLGNSHYTDSMRRARLLFVEGINMLDVGISGGIEGARNGACFMIGGDEEVFKTIEPVFKDISAENGYGYFGKSGAGHFVKMTHNAIEYGMMQAIAEGVGLLAKSEFQPDMIKLLDVWNHSSIIQSNLIGYLKEAYTNDPMLTNTHAEIGDLGTGKWAAQAALDLGAPFTAISHAIYTRYNSRDKEFIGWKVIEAMRQVFGGHSEKDRS